MRTPGALRSRRTGTFAQPPRHRGRAWHHRVTEFRNARHWVRLSTNLVPAGSLLSRTPTASGRIATSTQALAAVLRLDVNHEAEVNQSQCSDTLSC